MLFSLPIELQKLIFSFLTRKEYKETVPCKSLLFCQSYLSLEDFSKLKELPLISLSVRELARLFIKAYQTDNLFLVNRIVSGFKVKYSNEDTNISLTLIGAYLKMLENTSPCRLCTDSVFKIMNRILIDTRIDNSSKVIILFLKRHVLFI